MADEKLIKLIKRWGAWHHKTAGVLLILFGIWWYLKNIGIVSETIFWPTVLIALGITALAEVSILWKNL